MVTKYPERRYKAILSHSTYWSKYNIRGAYDKFLGFIRMGTFIDTTLMKL